MNKKDQDQYSEKETAKRRDDALRRAMATPPKPKVTLKKAKSPRKRAASKPKTA